jgi:hypothetical protein
MKLITDRLKKHRRIILITGGVALLLFCLVNIFWFVFRDVKYSRYSENMNESVFSTSLVPEYIANDEDGFSYGVNYPEYLQFTGNLFVAFPSTDEENPYTDSLIIWPLLKDGYEYGVILYTDDTQYQIYIDKNGNAINEEDENIVLEYSQSILTLLEKANTMWEIE